MIIFDTNAINRFNPRSPRADLVRALRASGQYRVGVPWVVLEELVAHQAKEYMTQRGAALKELKELRRSMVWRSADVVDELPLELEECQEYWRKAYGEIFEVVPTSGDAALKALSREAIALPPAKQGTKRAEGARDAAIWFTIVEYLREHPDEEVVFVTDNHKDFGDGAEYPYPMGQDLGDCSDRLKRIEDFDSVVAEFTTPVDGKAAAADAERHLGTDAVAEPVSRLAVDGHRAGVGFPGVSSTGAVVEWKGWIGAPQSKLIDVSEGAGHRIGQDIWYTTKAIWLLRGVAATVEGGFRGVACTWKIKLLFWGVRFRTRSSQVACGAAGTPQGSPCREVPLPVAGRPTNDWKFRTTALGRPLPVWAADALAAEQGRRWDARQSSAVEEGAEDVVRLHAFGAPRRSGGRRRTRFQAQESTLSTS
ncbi:PIN domain-containing protein [Kitasatospora sp. NPDC101235]|uniref:PIN domain-containing protein n=1 Tax=Kitasatospora sp. NPDC101235 TaxID=3364101 RepID=UPI00382479A8